ncbi:hypothetical protein SDC9_13757 [bioreactor metagenome]|uniref:Uncharacterized protein n=1 Tax=bioreactor metagenome TaxID=1076179 RepID=A0A644TMD3_9ZZZZ
MIFNATDLIFNLVEAKDIVIDSVVNYTNGIINLIKYAEIKWNVADNVLNAADFILDFV